MNLNENRRVHSSEYIDVQSGWDYFRKVFSKARRGYAVHMRVNGETKKGYALAVCALVLARFFNRPALLTYGGGHQQRFFPAKRSSFRYFAFAFLFRLPQRIYCNSEKVKKVLLTTGIPANRVEPIPHFSSYYVQFTPAPLDPGIEEFFKHHECVIFSYVCFRKEFALEFFARAIRRFREQHPKVGFLWVGPWSREMEGMQKFLADQKIADAVFLQGSMPHEMFLNVLSRAAAYVRTPVTDGICSSVLESLKLKVPVLAADNGARPPGTEVWKEGDLDSLLTLMTEAVKRHPEMVARIPDIPVEDNANRLADSIERVCAGFPGFIVSPGQLERGEVGARVAVRHSKELSHTPAVEQKVER